MERVITDSEVGIDDDFESLKYEIYKKNMDPKVSKYQEETVVHLIIVCRTIPYGNVILKSGGICEWVPVELSSRKRSRKSDG